MKHLYLSIFAMLLITNTMAQKEIKVQISQTYDDMEEFLPAREGETQDSTIGELDYDSDIIELGFKDGSATTPQLAGFRFSDIPIGQGREIVNAYIQFELQLDSYIDSCNFYIYAEDSVNAETFATAASGGPGGGPGGTPPSGGGAPGGGAPGSSSAPDYSQYELSARPKLNDSVQWIIAENEFITTDAIVNTSDITPLVQQVIDKENWETGNAMAFYIKGTTGTRVVESYDSDSQASAKLIINYMMNHADSVKVVQDSIQAARLDSILNLKTGNLKEEDYTIPTWTLLKRAEQTFISGYDYMNDTVTTQLESAVDSLQSSELPYNVCMAINGDTKSQIGFAWFTNMGIKNGEVQIVQGEINDTTVFSSPLFTFTADTTNILNLPYCNSKNGLDELAGFEDGDTRNYTSHKALATGLTENTTYSYRVGKNGAWSPIGNFKTAKEGDPSVRFIYMADTQAMNDEYFGISQDATLAAYQTIPDAQFCLMTGDLVESQGTSNSEWEWEQWFELMQPVWKNVPVAPVVGNHDISANKNLTYHFNTDSVDFDQEMSTTPGGVYSFVHGNALFIAMSTEDYRVDGFLDSLKQYVIDEVEAHPDVRWKFVFYHKTIYTGSSSHQSDSDSKTVREAFVPVFDSIGIDMAFQGHDHIYEVIGVTRNFELVDGSVVAVDTNSEEGGVRANMTGKKGGVFDVTNGTLFFLNCSAGKKKYSPRTQTEMDDASYDTGLTNYWGLFTGKFGQPDLATFSDVKITHDTVFVTTYTVDDDGNTIDEYDSFKVTKSGNKTTTYIVSAEASSLGSVSGTGTYENGSTVTLTAVANDGYQFDSWSGDILDTISPITFTLTSDVRVTANFIEKEEENTNFSVQISDNDDDVEEIGPGGDNTNPGTDFSEGDLYTSSSDLEMVTDGSVQTVGLRFNEINIPQGATIDTAYISFTAKGATSDATSLSIKIEDSANAVAFDDSDDYNVTGRTYVEDSVSWKNIESWTDLETYTTPDLSSLVEPVIGLEGWESGNSLVFAIYGSGNRRAYSAKNSSSNAPILVIKYSKNTLTGISSSFSAEPTFKIYPNPASSVLNIGGSEHIEKVAIFSITGERVIIAENKSQINISNLSNGVYLIKAKTNNGIFVEQFIVNKK